MGALGIFFVLFQVATVIAALSHTDNSFKAYNTAIAVQFGFTSVYVGLGLVMNWYYSNTMIAQLNSSNRAKAFRAKMVQIRNRVTAIGVCVIVLSLALALSSDIVGVHGYRFVIWFLVYMCFLATSFVLLYCVTMSDNKASVPITPVQG
jgi:hypothetical protein